MTAATMTTLSGCRQAARTAGLVPALTMLCDEVLPGLLPCGPAGHAVVPVEVAASADRVWLDGSRVRPRRRREKTLSTVALTEGALTMLHHRPAARTETADDGTALGTRAGVVAARALGGAARRVRALPRLAAAPATLPCSNSSW